MRTLIVVIWLGALLYAGRDGGSGPLMLALVLIWAVPLVRDRKRMTP